MYTDHISALQHQCLPNGLDSFETVSTFVVQYRFQCSMLLQSTPTLLAELHMPVVHLLAPWATTSASSSLLQCDHDCCIFSVLQSLRIICM
jgi:hypothetical protein